MLSRSPVSTGLFYCQSPPPFKKALAQRDINKHKPPFSPKAKGGRFMSDLSHAAITKTPEAFFAPSPLVLPIYQALEAWLLGLAGVSRVIHKTQISFYARKSIAYAWLPTRPMDPSPHPQRSGGS